jgi:hypothetical protein
MNAAFEQMAVIMRRKRQSLCLILAVGLALALGCADRGRTEPWPPIVDIQGRRHQPFDEQETKAVVLVFVLSDCPIANSYIPKLNQMYEEFVKLGVRLFVVQADPHATVKQVLEHAQSYEIAAPVLLDSKHKWVKLAGVTKTPEVAVFLPDGTMPYRGRIDDQYAGLGQRRAQFTSDDLRKAIESVLAGRPVEHPVTEAVGCFIPQLSVEGK